MSKPRILDNLGDQNPIDSGGYFVWSDGSAEWLEEPPDDADEQHQEWTVYRFDLDRFELILEDDGTWSMVTASLAQHLRTTKPEFDAWSLHKEWFQDSLPEIAQSADYPDGANGLRNDLCSPDILDRAWAYRDIGMYHGFNNLDSYPLTLTRAEVNARYRSVLRTLQRRRWAKLLSNSPRSDRQTKEA